MYNLSFRHQRISRTRIEVEKRSDYLQHEQSLQVDAVIVGAVAQVARLVYGAVVVVGAVP